MLLKIDLILLNPFSLFGWIHTNSLNMIRDAPDLQDKESDQHYLNAWPGLPGFLRLS
jgi:hypothetical protein